MNATGQIIGRRVLISRRDDDPVRGTVQGFDDLCICLTHAEVEHGYNVRWYALRNDQYVPWNEIVNISVLPFPMDWKTFCEQYTPETVERFPAA